MVDFWVELADFGVRLVKLGDIDEVEELWKSEIGVLCPVELVDISVELADFVIRLVKLGDIDRAEEV